MGEDFIVTIYNLKNQTSITLLFYSSPISSPLLSNQTPLRLLFLRSTLFTAVVLSLCLSISVLYTQASTHINSHLPQSKHQAWLFTQTPLSTVHTHSTLALSPSLPYPIIEFCFLPFALLHIIKPSTLVFWSFPSSYSLFFLLPVSSSDNCLPKCSKHCVKAAI